MDVGSLVGTGGSIVAIASLAGLGLQRGTVTNLRENLSDARNEISDKDRRNDEKDKKIALLEADLDATQRMKSGKQELVNLNAKLDEHHELAMAGQSKILEYVSQALGRLDVVSTALGGMVDQIVEALRRNKQ